MWKKQFRIRKARGDSERHRRVPYHVFDTFIKGRWPLYLKYEGAPGEAMSLRGLVYVLSGRWKRCQGGPIADVDFVRF